MWVGLKGHPVSVHPFPAVQWDYLNSLWTSVGNAGHPSQAATAAKFNSSLIVGIVDHPL